MLTFRDYMDKAKDYQGFPSDRQVALSLGITTAAVSKFCKGKEFPSQETVLRLANLAGVKPEAALIDFNLWKTIDKPNAHRIWLKISKMIGCIALFSIFFSAKTSIYDKDLRAELCKINNVCSILCIV